MSRRFTKLSQHRKSWYIYMMQIPGFLPNLFKIAPKSLKGWMLSLGGYNNAEETAIAAKSTLVSPSKQYRAFVWDLLQSSKFDASDRFSKPMMILWGKDDPFLNVPNLDELERDARDVQIRILDGSHWMHRNHHKVVNELISQFIL